MTTIPGVYRSTLGVETFAWRNFRAFRGFELATRKFIHAKISQARDPRKLILTKIFKLKSLIYQNYNVKIRKAEIVRAGILAIFDNKI